jgi:hypothetical protein
MTDNGQSFRHGLGGRPFWTEPIIIGLQCDNYWFSKLTFMTNTLTDCITDAITVGSGSYDRHWSIHSVMGLVVDRTGTEPIIINLQCDNYWFSKFTFMTNTLTDLIRDTITVGSCSYDRHWSIHSVMGLVVDRTGPSQSVLVCSVIAIGFQSLLS